MTTPRAWIKREWDATRALYAPAGIPGNEMPTWLALLLVCGGYAFLIYAAINGTQDRQIRVMITLFIEWPLIALGIIVSLVAAVLPSTWLGWGLLLILLYLAHLTSRLNALISTLQRPRVEHDYSDADD